MPAQGAASGLGAASGQGAASGLGAARERGAARGLRTPAQVVTWLGTLAPIGAVWPLDHRTSALLIAALVSAPLVALVWRRRGFAPPILTATLGFALGALAPRVALPPPDALVALAARAGDTPCAVEGVVAERARPWGEGRGLVVDVRRARCGDAEALEGRLRVEVPAGVVAWPGDAIAGQVRLVAPPGDDALRFRLRALAARRGIAVEGAWVASSTVGAPAPPPGSTSSPGPAATAADAVDPDVRRRVGLGASRALGGLGLVASLAASAALLTRRRRGGLASRPAAVALGPAGAAPSARAEPDAAVPAGAHAASTAPADDGEAARALAWPPALASALSLGALLLAALVAGDPSLLRLLGPTLALTALLVTPAILDPRPTFAATVLLTTLVDPASLGDLRYQLAFAGALTLAGPVRAWARRRGWGAAALAAAPLLALGTLPLVARQSPHVSLASLALGVLTTPLAALAALPRLFIDGPSPNALEAAVDALAAALAQVDPAPLATPSVFACLLLYAAIGPIAAPAPRDAPPVIVAAARRARRLGALAALGLVGLAAMPTLLGRAERTAVALPGGAIVVTTRDAPFARGRATLVSPPVSAPRRARLERVLGALRWARHAQLERFVCVGPRTPTVDADCAHTARALAAEVRVDAVVRVDGVAELDPAVGLEVFAGAARDEAADGAQLRVAVDPARSAAVMWRFEAGRWSQGGLDDDASGPALTPR